ncbi:MAG TPA: hypothetical protein VNA22_01770, partial [Pyrinomonadaceae bacterium]|nr:hypothetical protein [Pyrinomonadaceae bacterium]
DGAALLVGPGWAEEPATKILSGGSTSSAQAVDREKLKSTARPVSSIAVLPFIHLSSDPEDEYFCDGLAEELLNALAKVEGLNVASRTSAFSFKGKNVTMGEIAEALGVSSVLEGSVRRSGNRLRIGIQLINASDDRRVWTERFDREMKDIFDIQDEIALCVVDALKVKLLGDERAAVLKRYTNNPHAYELFLKGRSHWYKHTPEAVQKSAAYFKQAIEIDPDYAPGHAGLAEFYGLSAALGMMDPDVGWRLAEATMTRARELDDSIPEIHNGLAAIRGMYYRDFPGAELELQRAMRLNAKFVEVHSLRSVLLTAEGRFDEAITDARKAVEMEPLSITYRRYLGWWFHYARRFDEAVAKYTEVLGMDSYFVPVYQDLSDTYFCKGDIENAVRSWRKLVGITGDEEISNAIDTAESPARAMAAASNISLDRLNRRLAAGDWVAPAEIARCYVRLGDSDNAFSWLEKASKGRDFFSLFLSVDPFYDPLRSDPRFDEMLQKQRSMS